VNVIFAVIVALSVGLLTALGNVVFGILVQHEWDRRGVGRSVDRIRERVSQGWNAVFRRRHRTRKLPTGEDPAGLIRIGDLRLPGFRLFDGVRAEGIEFVVNFDPTPAVLPAELIPVRTAVEDRIRADEENGLRVPFNGEMLALKGFTFTRSADGQEKSVCRMSVQPNEYFNLLATINSLAVPVPGTTQTIGDRYYHGRNPLLIEHPALFTAFPINLAVITSDEKLVVVQRSADVAMSPNVFNSSADEAVSRYKDTDSAGRVSYQQAARRALWEELGVAPGDIAELKLTAVGYAHRVHHYAVLGHARLAIPYGQLVAGLSFAEDGGFEIAVTEDGGFRIHSVPFNPPAFSRFLIDHVSKDAPITSFGLACFLVAFLATGDTASTLSPSFRGAFFERADFIV
jgi:8-oxo-dGTP pyrophosphatase MutT (NUDIX family)